MCPACLTTMALWAAGATSASGLTWMVARRIGPRTRRSAPATKESPHESR